LIYFYSRKKNCEIAMSQPESTPDDAPKKKSKLPLLLGLVGALALGGGGFYATFSGMILGNHEAATEAHGDQAVASAMPDVAFVAIDPIVISLGREAGSRHLRFASQLEVGSHYADEVKQLQPRIVDVLNSYLRAVEIAQLEDPSALIRLKAQMLRRIQIVSGEGRVRDLLISEFVLN
jgi:flagellar protein FliL